MAYSPSQTAMARASIVGQAAGDIRNQFINASQNIRSIIKDKNINEKIDAAYKNAEDNFVQQAVASGIDETSARIKSQHFFRQFPMEGVDTETRIKNLLASGMRAEDYLSRMQTQAEEKRLTQQKATSAEAAVSGGREYGMPSQIQAPGGSFTEETVTETAPPAQYQEEAMSTYAQMQAQGRAPVQPVKELQQQAAIGALPKRPEPEKPMTEYQKEQIRVGDERNKIARMKAAREAKMSNKDLLKNKDENIKWTRTQRRLMDGSVAKYKNYVTSIEKIINKINKDAADNKITELDLAERDKLADMGINDADMLNIQKLDQIQNEYEALAEKGTKESKEYANAEKFLRENDATATLSEGFTYAEKESGKTLEQQKQAAYQYIKQHATPTLYNDVNSFLSVLPRNLRAAIESEIEDARKFDATDQEILQALKMQTQMVK